MSERKFIIDNGFSTDADSEITGNLSVSGTVDASALTVNGSPLSSSRTQYMGFVKLGNTPTWHGDTGMSVSRVSQGVYKVTIPGNYSNVDDYMVQVQYQASNAQNMVTVSKSNSNVTFSVYQESTGNYVDSGELVIVLTNL